MAYDSWIITEFTDLYILLNSHSISRLILPSIGIILVQDTDVKRQNLVQNAILVQ